ncbi:hypothetical protein ACQPW3_20670 [Actinosynnema sp. CA-248983]
MRSLLAAAAFEAAAFEAAAFEAAAFEAAAFEAAAFEAAAFEAAAFEAAAFEAAAFEAAAFEAAAFEAAAFEAAAFEAAAFDAAAGARRAPRYLPGRCSMWTPLVSSVESPWRWRRYAEGTRNSRLSSAVLSRFIGWSSARRGVVGRLGEGGGVLGGAFQAGDAVHRAAEVGGVGAVAGEGFGDVEGLGGGELAAEEACGEGGVAPQLVGEDRAAVGDDAVVVEGQLGDGVEAGPGGAGGGGGRVEGGPERDRQGRAARVAGRFVEGGELAGGGDLGQAELGGDGAEGGVAEAFALAQQHTGQGEVACERVERARGDREQDGVGLGVEAEGEDVHRHQGRFDARRVHGCPA